MSKDYGIVFVKNDRYRGGWALTNFTTRSTVEEVMKIAPELFIGGFYETHEGDYQAIEMQVSEENTERLENLQWERQDDVLCSVFKELKEAMERAIRNEFKMFLA